MRSYVEVAGILQKQLHYQKSHTNMGDNLKTVTQKPSRQLIGRSIFPVSFFLLFTWSVSTFSNCLLHFTLLVRAFKNLAIFCSPRLLAFTHLLFTNWVWWPSLFFLEQIFQSKENTTIQRNVSYNKQNLKQKPWWDTACWFILWLIVNWLSLIARNYLSRDGATHCGISLPTSLIRFFFFFTS